MADSLDELRDMNLKDLIEKLNLPDDEFYDWFTVCLFLGVYFFKDLGFFHRARRCPHGDYEMLLRLEYGRREWICRKRGCERQHGDKRVKKGFLTGTFFERVDNMGMIKKV